MEISILEFFGVREVFCIFCGMVVILIGIFVKIVYIVCLKIYVFILCKIYFINKNKYWERKGYEITIILKIVDLGFYDFK